MTKPCSNSFTDILRIHSEISIVYLPLPKSTQPIYRSERDTVDMLGPNCKCPSRTVDNLIAFGEERNRIVRVRVETDVTFRRPTRLLSSVEIIMTGWRGFNGTFELSVGVQERDEKNNMFATNLCDRLHWERCHARGSPHGRRPSLSWDSHLDHAGSGCGCRGAHGDRTRGPDALHGGRESAQHGRRAGSSCDRGVESVHGGERGHAQNRSARRQTEECGPTDRRQHKFSIWIE